MSFKSYVEDLQNAKTVVYSFGRHQPIHKGLESLWESMSKFTKRYNAKGVVFTSHTVNSRKNPLPLNEKLKLIEKLLPDNLEVSSGSFKNAFEITKELIDEGYKRLFFIVGPDKVNDYQSLKNYVNEWSNGTADIRIIPSSENPEYSGGKMRTFARQNNLEAFLEDLPKDLSKEEGIELFEKVKKGLK